MVQFHLGHEEWVADPESRLLFLLPAETQCGAVNINAWIRENGWIGEPDPLEHCAPSGWVGTD